jgi:hypothetical protein
MVRPVAYLVGTTLLAALLVLGADSRMDAGKKGNVGGNAKDKEIAHELLKVNDELARAIPDFNGHRANAMRAIHAAATALGSTAGMPTPAKTPDNQAKSDHVLRTVVKHLSHIQQQLSKVANSPPHATAAQAVRSAIGELETALSLK